MTSDLLYKRADLVLVDKMPRVAGAFTCAPVEMTQATRCMRPTAARCAVTCQCGFSAYPTRAEALSFQAPLSPVCEVAGRDFVRPPTRRPHAIYRHQQVTAVCLFPTCWTCGAPSVGYGLRDEGPDGWDLRVVSGSCEEHHTLPTHRRGPGGAPDLLTAGQVGELWGVAVREAGEVMSSLMTGRHVQQAQPPPRVRRCWCGDLVGMTAAGGERLYFELGLFAGRDFYTCNACGVRWRVDRDGPWYLTKTES